MLTFDPSEFDDRWHAYRKAGELWDHSLRRAIERQVEAFCDQLFAPTEDRLAYVQTWERHANGWPHVNVLLSSERLRALVEAWGVQQREHGKRGRVCLFPRRWRKWLRERAIAAGFGRSIWVEVINSAHDSGGERMTNYLLKLAKELTGADAKKGGQSPIDAPRHFRRIRASHKLLPPHAKSSGLWTGVLLNEPIALELRNQAGGADRGAEEPGDERQEFSVSFSQVERWIDHQAALRAGHWIRRDPLDSKLLRGDPLWRHLPRIDQLGDT